jgi:hypothetical protein
MRPFTGTSAIPITASATAYEPLRVDGRRRIDTAARRSSLQSRRALYADSAVSTAKIDGGAVTTAKITSAAVASTQIANEAVTSEKIAPTA